MLYWDVHIIFVPIYVIGIGRLISLGNSFGRKDGSSPFSTVGIRRTRNTMDIPGRSWVSHDDVLNTNA